MKQFAVTATMATLLAATVLSTSALAAAKPDLKVSAIATPGGICSQNKVRVTVVNSQQAGVSDPIPVILTVSQPPNQPTAHVGTLENGIGPNANSGLPVWFHNIPVQANGGPVTLRAHVNPDLEVEESVYNNNTKVVTVNCAPQISTSLLAYWKVNLRDYLKRPLSGVLVSVAGQQVRTDKSGAAVFKGIKPGMQKMRIARKGCKTINSRVRVSAKRKVHNINLGKQCI